MSEAAGLDVGGAGRVPPAYLARGGGRGARGDADGGVYLVSHGTVAAPGGVLPLLMVAADAVWQAATRRGLGVMLQPDGAALLGWRVTGAHPGTPFSAVVLSAIEAVNQVRRQDGLLLNDLVQLPLQAQRLAAMEHAPAPQAAPAVRP